MERSDFQKYSIYNIQYSIITGLPLGVAGKFLRQEPELRIDRLILPVLRMGLGPLDKHIDSFVARRWGIGETDHCGPIAPGMGGLIVIIRPHQITVTKVDGMIEKGIVRACRTQI